jgi:patatin-like phospholipase/acyl hydrolase
VPNQHKQVMSFRLPSLDEAKKSGYLDLSKQTCYTDVKHQKDFIEKSVGFFEGLTSLLHSTRRLEVFQIDDDETISRRLQATLRYANTSGIYRINLNGWNNPQIVRFMIREWDEFHPSLIQLDLQECSISEKMFRELQNKLCGSTEQNGEKVYLNKVIKVDLTGNDLDAEPLYAALREKDDYIKYRDLEKDFRSTLDDIKDTPLLIDRYNDMAAYSWHLRSYPFFANEALYWSTKAKDAYIKRYKEATSIYYRNLAACCIHLNKHKEAAEYAAEIHESVSKTTEWNLPDRTKPPIVILSLDGGGIRGLAMVKMLECIGNYLGQPLHGKMFNMVCGTSTGGILALGLGSGKLTTRSSRDLFYKLAEEIFEYKFGDFTKGVLNSMRGGWYSTGPLKKMILENLGEKKLLKTKSINEIKPLMFVTAVDQIANKTYHLRNYEHESGNVDCTVYEAARCTCAAPFYFTPYELTVGDKKCEMVDGGLTRNNPTFHAYKEASSIFGKHRDYVIISLGTGIQSEQEKERLFQKKSFNLAFAASLTMLITIATDSEAQHKHMEATAAREPISYFRFNPIDLPVTKLHESKKELLQMMEQATEKYMQSEPVQYELQRLKKILDVAEKYKNKEEVISPKSGQHLADFILTEDHFSFNLEPPPQNHERIDSLFT